MRTLEDLVCFDLYAASRAMTGRYRPLLEPLGLTYPQYLVLVAVVDDRPRTVSELAERLELDHGTLSPLLRRLEAAGLVRRARSTRDERVVEVTVTERGAEVRRQFDDVQCAIEESLGLTAEEVRVLQQSLRRLAAQVRGGVDAGRA